jgi:hypothetical protein
MANKLLKFVFLFLLSSVIVGCGIKKPPQPLPEPSFEVKRIGKVVYIIPLQKGISAEGFLKKGDFLIRIDGRSFCFNVRHPLGKKKEACVPPAGGEKPSVALELAEDRVILNLRGYGSYRIYPVQEDGFLIPREIKEIKGTKAVLDRRFKDYKVAITGVMPGRESSPLVIEVLSRDPPVPEPPRDLQLVRRGQKIYLYWWHGEENLTFMVLRNGELLTKEPIRTNAFSDKAPQEETLYEVIAINRFNVKSPPARIIYKP